MFLKHLILRSFRNYSEALISFERGINIIQGRNGAGKTNLLEAICLLSTGRSFRTVHLTDLIKKGASYFYIEAQFEQENVAQVLGIGYDGKGYRIHHNRTSLRGFVHLLGILPSVFYTPKDNDLISGTPAERRRFLNVQLSQMTPLYVHHLIRYHKAMKHRNALLKQKSQRAITSFEQVMALSAAYLMKKRSKLINALKPRMRFFARKLSLDEDSFNLFYEPSISMKRVDDIASLYAGQRHKELMVGTTLQGPHRDDFLITYDEKDAKTYASEGQKRSCITALKMAEWEELKNTNSHLPLMNIDDFGIHLDKQRLYLLKNMLKNFGQIFLTTPLIDKMIGTNCCHIEGGALYTHV